MNRGRERESEITILLQSFESINRINFNAQAQKPIFAINFVIQFHAANITVEHELKFA